MSDQKVILEPTQIPEAEPIFITGKDRITTDILSRFEVAKIISDRANEIQNGAKFSQAILKDVDWSKVNHPSIFIAEKELELGLIPYKLYRYMGGDEYEVWDVSEMYYR